MTFEFVIRPSIHWIGPDWVIFVLMCEFICLSVTDMLIILFINLTLSMAASPLRGSINTEIASPQSLQDRTGSNNDIVSRPSEPNLVGSNHMLDRCNDWKNMFGTTARALKKYLLNVCELSLS